jgi:hypothetical protein
LDVLGIAGKLAKNVFQLWWQIFFLKQNLSSYKLPKIQTTKFGFGEF